jgi:hypothetical protein
MVTNLLESLSTFTILPLRRTSSGPVGDIAPNEKNQEKKRALVYGFAPLSGLLFGLLAAILIWELHGKTPILASWLVPIFWFFFSGAQPFASLCRAGGALFAKSKAAGAELLSRESFTGLGMSVGLLLLTGEFFALIQGSSVPRFRLATIVLLVPIISRFTAVIFACSTWGRTDGTGFGRYRTLTYLIAGAITTLISLVVSVELGLLLLVVSLLICTVFSAVLYSRTDTIPQSSFGAMVLLAEIACPWIGTLYALL